MSSIVPALGMKRPREEEEDTSSAVAMLIDSQSSDSLLVHGASSIRTQNASMHQQYSHVEHEFDPALPASMPAGAPLAKVARLEEWGVSYSSGARADSSLWSESIAGEAGEDGEGALSDDLAEAISGPYKPSSLLDHPEVLAMALRIAQHFEADFEDKEVVRRVASLVKDVSDAEAALYEAQRAAAAEPTVSTGQTLASAHQRFVSLSKSLDIAIKSKASKYVRNVRDSILRVTLVQGASTVNAVAGHMAGEGLDVERPTLKCDNCGNDEEGSFLSDPKQADTICTNCGLVVADSALHDGDWTRSFEGEESTSQIGPPPDPLLSNRFNLRTGMALGAGVPKARMRALRLMAEAVEMGSGSSAAGLADKRTRLGYKDKMKMRARQELEAAGERMEMAKPVIERACQLFAAFRDNREHLTAKSEALAGCLTAAYEASMHGRLSREAVARLENDAEQSLVAHEAEETERESAAQALMMGPQDAPIVRAVTAADEAAARAASERRVRERDVMEERRARALGLLGASHMMPDVTEDSDSSDSEDEGSRLAGAGAGAGARATTGSILGSTENSRRDKGSNFHRIVMARGGQGRQGVSDADVAQFQDFCDKGSNG